MNRAVDARRVGIARRVARGASLTVVAGALLLAAVRPAAAQVPPFELYLSPASATARRAAMERLSTTVDAALGATRRGPWGVMVVSLSNGDTLYDRNAGQMLLPASTMKLFTSALALDQFGPEGRFETRLLHTGSIANGVLDGDLVLRGAGDPSLSTRPLARGEVAPIVQLARAVAAAGIRRITGSLVGDASAFDDAKVPDGWLSRYLHASYAARVSALSFNENKVVLVVGAGAKGATVRFSPAIADVAISSSVRVVAGSRGARVVVEQDTARGRVRVTGWIGALSKARYYSLVVEDPELFAVGALKAALADAGVKVDGPIRVGDTGLDTGSPTVASLASPTVERLVTQMNGESNNHFAELLFRNAALGAAERGSATTANSLLGQFLFDKVRADSAEVFAADGSGLSTLDRVTPRAMVQLLGYARIASWGAVLEQSLPIAGKTETLARRMRRTPAAGNLRAKTGTTNDVASLGGYVTAGNGESLAFSIIYNGTDRLRAREAIDKVGVALATFNR